MSFQAYLDNIRKKTGKTPDDFRKLAEKKGLLKGGVKAAEIVSWLKKDFDLGHGHAMAIYTVFKGSKERREPLESRILAHFSGSKAKWKPMFDSLMKKLSAFGDDVSVSPTDTYLSILRGNRKMAIVQVTAGRMDIGIKLKGVPPDKQFEAAGSWNAMMTHRVRIKDGESVDGDVMSWLRSAYEQNAEMK